MLAGTRLVVTLMWVLTSSLATAAGAIESLSPIDLAKIETRKSFSGGNRVVSNIAQRRACRDRGRGLSVA